jgi:prepilin-type processing-associated H-X9-DG protein
MGRIVVVALILLVAVVAIGIVLSGISRARQEEEFRRCQNNLRELGLTGLSHSTVPGQAAPIEPNNYYPPGTLVNPNLLPDQRLSWYALVLAPIDQGPPGPAPKPLRFADMLKEIDVAKPWDAEVHQRLARMRLNVAICPAQRPDAGENQPALANYLGNGGIGPGTAALPLSEAGTKAGVFRYDTPTPFDKISDGLSNTILLVESARGLGPWLRGGPSTIRSLDPDVPPYLGPGRLYAGCHQGRGNFAIADGSVRVISNQVNPAVFRAMLTINGAEKEAEFDVDQ